MSSELTQAQKMLGNRAVFFHEWQYETAFPFYAIGRVRQYFNADGSFFTSSLFDSENQYDSTDWTQCSDDLGEEQWSSFEGAYNALAYTIARQTIDDVEAFENLSMEQFLRGDGVGSKS